MREDLTMAKSVQVVSHLLSRSTGREPRNVAPQLVPGHLVLLIASAAAAVAIARWIWPASGNVPLGIQLMLHVSAVVGGIVVCVTGLGIDWVVRGQAYLYDPGQWLAAAMALMTAIGATNPFAGYFPLLVGSPGSVASAWAYWTTLDSRLAVVLICAGYVALAIFASDTILWRAFFATVAAETAIHQFLPLTAQTLVIGGAALLILSLAAIVLLLVIAARESRTRTVMPRHWTHWVGLAAGFSTIAANLLISWLVL
jgi:hypothetical protein